MQLNVKRFALTTLAGFIFIFAFEFVVHGILLADTYEQTTHLWRPMEDMASYMPFMHAMQLAFVTILAFIYTRHHEGKGLSEGIRFGSYLGLLLGVVMISMYAWMPISFTLAAMWFAATLIEIIALGIIFSLIYKN